MNQGCLQHSCCYTEAQKAWKAMITNVIASCKQEPTVERIADLNLDFCHGKHRLDAPTVMAF